MRRQGRLDQAAQPLQDAGRRKLAISALTMGAGIGLGAVPALAATGRPAARLSADDRFGIEDLFARYAWCYDCSSEDDYLSNFTDDAIVIGIGPGQTYHGKEGIRSWYRYLLGLRAAEGDDWLHDAYHHQCFGDRRGCLVYSYATHYNSNTAARRLGVRSAGYFVSECVRQGDGWLFRRHSVNRWDRAALPWKKPLPWAAA